MTLLRKVEDSREGGSRVGPGRNVPGRQCAGVSSVLSVLSGGPHGDDRDRLPRAFSDLGDSGGAELQSNAALAVAQVDVTALKDRARCRSGA